MENKTKELLFLDYLFDGEIVRTPTEAKELAGYPANYPVLKIMKEVQKDLIDRMDCTASLYVPQAFMALIELMNEPETPGNKVKLQILLEVLDRGGLVKKEKAEVAQVAPSFILMLPQKAEISNN